VRKILEAPSFGPEVPHIRPIPGKRELIAGLQDEDIEVFVRSAARRISTDARLVGIDRRSFETQVRLHLPRLPRMAIRTWPRRKTYEAVRVAALVRCGEIRQASEDAAYQAQLSLLLGGETVRKDLTFTGDNEYCVPFRFGPVLPSIGNFVQSRLHYLRSARGDTSLEFGLYVPGASMPLTYIAFSPCDRSYIIAALRALGINANPQEVLVLTRMHGLPGIPRNLMSLTIGQAVRRLRADTSVKYVVTAFNPMLGFEGTTFHATGFSPFALSPVVYAYDESGFFSTRRLGRGRVAQRLDVSNNVLLAAGVTRDVKRRLSRASGRICQVPAVAHQRKDIVALKSFDMRDPGCMRRLGEYRRTLESCWSRETVHPRYSMDAADVTGPRGQCGVSSVWLARRLRSEFGMNSTYCYGRLSVALPGVKSVDHHCWVEIGDHRDAGRMVIDLTCDQAEGLQRSVLCDRHDDLAARGLSYEVRSRLDLDELPEDRVWRRFLALSDAAAVKT
jgi:hypothetical protein